MWFVCVCDVAVCVVFVLSVMVCSVFIPIQRVHSHMRLDVFVKVTACGTGHDCACVVFGVGFALSVFSHVYEGLVSG